MIQWFSKKLKNRKGFTLIELIVVIAILGILAVIAIPRLGQFTQNATTQRDLADVRIVEGAAAMFHANTGGWPADVNALVTANYIDDVPASLDGSETFDVDGNLVP